MRISYSHLLDRKFSNSVESVFYRKKYKKVTELVLRFLPIELLKKQDTLYILSKTKNIFCLDPLIVSTNVLDTVNKNNISSKIFDHLFSNTSYKRSYYFPNTTFTLTSSSEYLKLNHQMTFGKKPEKHLSNEKLVTLGLEHTKYFDKIRGLDQLPKYYDFLKRLFQREIKTINAYTSFFLPHLSHPLTFAITNNPRGFQKNTLFHELIHLFMDQVVSIEEYPLSISSEYEHWLVEMIMLSYYTINKSSYDKDPHFDELVNKYGISKITSISEIKNLIEKGK